MTRGQIEAYPQPPLHPVVTSRVVADARLSALMDRIDCAA
jgi:hypothetical protein